VPCVDNLWEKCTWEFEFVVPRYLDEQDLNRRNEDEDESDEVNDSSPTLVVCSGELVEQVSCPALFHRMPLKFNSRSLIHTIQAKRSFFFLKLSLLPFNKSHLQRVHSISIQFLLTAL
jgi:hypothetical protein